MKLVVWPLLCAVGCLLLQDVWAEDTVALPDNTLYVDACGRCHLAYPPGLLPTRSWEKLLGNMQDHFGKPVSVTDTGAITAYVTTRAADRSSSILSGQIVQSLRSSEPPQRIVDIPFINHEHEDVPQRLITDNPGVRSLSNCASCHPHAQAGSFRESEVDIPGHGRWLE
jgi:Dihaem cytochrome c